MKLAKRGEDFSQNTIVNDSIALVKVRGTEISKITIIGGFPGSVVLDKESKATKNFLSSHRKMFEERDLENLQGAIVAIYATKKGKKETSMKKAMQLAEILENEIFSQIKTIELIGYGEMGLIFLLAANYVKRNLHIATINIAGEIPYLGILYADSTSLNKLTREERVKYRNKFLKHVDFETVNAGHIWLNFQDKQLKLNTVSEEAEWIKEMNKKMATESSLKVLSIPSKTIELDLNYSTVMQEVHRYFDR